MFPTKTPKWRCGPAAGGRAVYGKQARRVIPPEEEKRYYPRLFNDLDNISELADPWLAWLDTFWQPTGGARGRGARRKTSIDHNEPRATLMARTKPGAARTDTAASKKPPHGGLIEGTH